MTRPSTHRRPSPTAWPETRDVWSEAPSTPDLPLAERKGRIDGTSGPGCYDTKDDVGQQKDGKQAPRPYTHGRPDPLRSRRESRRKGGERHEDHPGHGSPGRSFFPLILSSLRDGPPSPSLFFLVLSSRGLYSVVCITLFEPVPLSHTVLYLSGKS